MPDLDHERQFNAPVIGIDEAGRGPWAGPVTVTAIWLCPSAYDTLPAGIDDSKKIKPPRRAALAAHAAKKARDDVAEAHRANHETCMVWRLGEARDHLIY